MRLRNIGWKKFRFLFLTIALAFFSVTIFGWKNFYALAQTVIDSFTSTDKVADQWNVTVDIGAGEVKLAEKSCDNGTWFCEEDDVCSNQLGDGDFIVVKRINEAANKQWKTAQTNCDRPECQIDGGQNNDNIVADNTVNFSSYPARDACKAVGGRLPTIGELQCIYANRATFGDNFGTSYYWSSTEYSTPYAWGVSFSTGTTSTSNKPGSLSVRCVRGW